VLGQLELGDEEIDVLVERTEGWPAALVLAWLWLRTLEDPAPAVRAFGGDNRLLAPLATPLPLLPACCSSARSCSSCSRAACSRTR
jgi:hypothetical protein